MDEQQRIDKLQNEILEKTKDLDKKKAKAKSLRAEHTVLEEQLSYLQQQVKLKQDEIKIRRDKLQDLKESGDGPKKNKQNFSEKDRKRKDFDMQVSAYFDEFIAKNPGLTTCKIGRPTFIKVKYLKGAKDGELDSLDNATLFEAKFRINANTRLNDLKSVACLFWGIEQPETMALREANLATMELYMNELVQDLLFKEQLSDELYLFEINRQSICSFSQQEDCFSEFAAERKTRPRKVKKSTIPKADLPHLESELEIMYTTLEEAYHGLKSFREPNDAEINEFQDRRTKRRESSLLFAVLLIIMLGCTITTVVLRRSVSRDFWMQAGVHSQLLTTFEGNLDFFDIDTIDGINLYLSQVFAYLAFQPDETSLIEPFSQRYTVIGPIRFRQLKVKFEACSQTDYLLEGSCIAETYTDSTRQTAPFGVWNYTSASENGIRSTVDGQLASYDGGGYVVDFNSTLNSTNFITSYQEMVNTGWYNISTQAMFVTTILYAPSYDMWISVMLLFEFTLTNYIIPTRLTAEVFTPNFFGKRSDRFACQILDIIRLVMSLYLIYLYVQTTREMRKGKRNWTHLYSTLGLMDCLTFVLILASFSMSYMLNANDGRLYADNAFFDAEYYSYNYKICLILNAAVILLLMLRLVFCFRLSRSVHIHLYTIEIASKNVLAFLLILLPIIIGFVILTMNVYGTDIFEFRSFEQALLEILLLISGYGDMLQMFLNFRIWTVFLWLMYFFGIVFFLISAFMGIYMDAYRQVKMLCGKKDKFCEKATKKMYCDWVKDSLPPFLQKRLFKQDED